MKVQHFFIILLITIYQSGLIIGGGCGTPQKLKKCNECPTSCNKGTCTCKSPMGQRLGYSKNHRNG
uniref:Uncharacterized protein n=1 Tax=Romanomermis culicivorax TaxID=13658 RepID=A0A915ICT3_ROMCU